MRQVIVNAAAVYQMKNEMRSARRTETGGVLVGYRVGDSLVVTAASGPGPRARLRRFSVTIDGVYARDFCVLAEENSGGRNMYVGDWHCHLACTYSPSSPDLKAMELMADFPSSPTRTPISLIWAKFRRKFAVYVFTEKRRLEALPSLIKE